MTRNLDTAWLTVDRVRIAYFVEVEHASGTLRFWTGLGNYTWDGQVWTGAGNLLGLEFATETTELRAEGARVTLNGCNVDSLAAVISESVQGAPLNIWVGWFDPDATPWALIADARNPYKIFGGGVDVPTPSIGPAGMQISVTAESKLAKLQRAPRRRYTSEDQKAEFPDDKGFDFVTSLQGKQGQWGAGPTGIRPRLMPPPPPPEDSGSPG